MTIETARINVQQRRAAYAAAVERSKQGDKRMIVHGAPQGGGPSPEQLREAVEAAASALRNAERELEAAEAAHAARVAEAAAAAREALPGIAADAANAEQRKAAAWAALDADAAVNLFAEAHAAVAEQRAAGRRFHYARQQAAPEPDALAATMDELGDDAAAARRALPEYDPARLPPLTPQDMQLKNGALVRVLLAVVDEAAQRMGIIIE